MNTEKHLLNRGFLRAVFIIIVCFSISGCYSIKQYVASAENYDKVTTFKSRSLAVEKFESYEPGKKSVICRASAGVQTPNDVSFESYIEQAFIDELRLAGAYDPKSTIVVHGRLENIESSSGPIIKGIWSMRLAISSNSNPGFTVDSTYEFPVDWVFWEACDQVAKAFVHAVRQLINQVVTHPQFGQLAP